MDDQQPSDLLEIATTLSLATELVNKFSEQELPVAVRSRLGVMRSSLGLIRAQCDLVRRGLVPELETYPHRD